MGRSYYEVPQLFDASTELARFEASYPSSSYLDNGRYYLGRSFFDRRDYPPAIPPFERVFLTAGSAYADNSRYYLGRSHYALGQLTAALADFQDLVATYPISQYVDNGLYYEVRVYVDQGNCSAACGPLSKLRLDFPASPELPRAESYAGGCGC